MATLTLRSRRLRTLSAGALGAAFLVAALRSARADEPFPAPERRYVVLTNDGSRYEGELVERVVGDHVTIKLVTGEARVIPAASIKAEWRAGQHSSAVPEGPGGVVVVQPIPPVVVGVLDTPVAYHGPDELLIHLTNANNESGTLYREGASGWEAICVLPCTTTVDPKITYKLHNSDPFRFPPGPRSLDLVADYRGRRRAAAIGWTMNGLALAGAVVGLVLVGVSAAGPGPGQSASAVSSDTTAGWITVAISAALLVGGIVVLATSPSTTVTTTNGVPIARAPSIRLPGNLRLTPSGITF